MLLFYRLISEDAIDFDFRLKIFAGEADCALEALKLSGTMTFLTLTLESHSLSKRTLEIEFNRRFQFF